MVNYGNGKIYKIESNLGDKIYIGSTTKTLLSQRMTNHRTHYKRWKSGKTHITTSFLLFEEYGVEHCKIVLLEDCPCESKDQLSAREAHYIKTLVCVNKVIPLRTTAEWREANQEDISAKRKAYYQANRDETLVKTKAYYQANRDEALVKKKAYYQANRDETLDKQKAYYQANRDETLEKQKAYQQANRDKIAEKKKAYREANRDALAEKRKAKYQAKKAVE